MNAEALDRRRNGAVLYTCEHAASRVPTGLFVDTATQALLAQHWGSDLGAAWLTRALGRRGRSSSVLSRYSRLVIDVNRAPGQDGLVLVKTLDGPVSFNQALSVEEVKGRLLELHASYHRAVEAMLFRREPRALVSVHTFTPVWQGVPREVEAGVLFDAHEPLALALVDSLRAEGFRTEANEPYSGKAGLIYSAARHGQATGIPYLEIELRQDLVATKALAEGVAARVHRALTAVGLG